MIINPLAGYAKQFQDSLEQYERYIQEQNHLTTEYVAAKKEAYKWMEEQLKLEFEKIRSMNIADIYLNSINMTLPKLYWNIYILWLEKMKAMYDLDTEYLKTLIVSTNPIAKNNPFLNMYSIFDVYNHFNFLKNISDKES